MGISSSFDEIYNNYAKELFSVIYYYLHDKENSEEILQEVFLKYLEGHIKLKGNDLKYYLIRIAINKSLDEIKRLNKISEYKEEVSTSARKYDYVYEEINKLPTKYKDVIILYYYQEYQINEIANILKTSNSAIKMRLKRAKEILKEKLKDERY